MRLFVINCLLLASVAVALPNERHKRDLSHIKNWITSTFFGQRQPNIQPALNVQPSSEHKLFRLPGYDDILIKVVPRRDVVEKLMVPEPMPINLNAFSTVVGIKDKNDILEALKGVNKLVSTGILNGKENHLIKENIHPMFPTLNFEQFDGPERVTDIVGSVPIIKTKGPELTEVVNPINRKVEVDVPFVPKYSYIQTKNNEPVMTYTAHYNPVKLEETIEMKPTCAKERNNEVLQLEPNPSARALFPSKPTRIGDILYPEMQINPYLQNNLFPSVETERVISEYEMIPQTIKDDPIQGHFDRRPVKTRPLYPWPSHGYKPPFEVKPINELKTEPKKGDVSKVDFSFRENQKKVTSVPNQSISHIVKKGLPNGAPTEKSADQSTRVSVLGSKDTVSNEKISSDVYSQQINPNISKMIMKDRMNANVHTQSNSNVKMPGYYYFFPENLHHKALTKKVAKVHKVTTTPQSVTGIVNTNTPKENSVYDRISSKANSNKPSNFNQVGTTITPKRVSEIALSTNSPKENVIKVLNHSSLKINSLGTPGVNNSKITTTPKRMSEIVISTHAPKENHVNVDDQTSIKFNPIVLHDANKVTPNQRVMVTGASSTSVPKENLFKETSLQDDRIIVPYGKSYMYVQKRRDEPKEFPVKENEQNPLTLPVRQFKSNYVFKQKNADGSSMSVLGNKDGVFVNLQESNTKGRGDIPDD